MFLLFLSRGRRGVYLIKRPRANADALFFQHGLEIGTLHPNLFGGGDCIYFEDRPLDKVGVYAVRENPVLYHNLKAALEGNDLQAFDPGGDYLLIFNLGSGIGVLQKRWLLLSGKAAFMIKDYIDRSFMAEYKPAR